MKSKDLVVGTHYARSTYGLVSPGYGYADEVVYLGLVEESYGSSWNRRTRKRPQVQSVAGEHRTRVVDSRQLVCTWDEWLEAKSAQARSIEENREKRAARSKRVQVVAVEVGANPAGWGVVVDDTPVAAFFFSDIERLDSLHTKNAADRYAEVIIDDLPL